MTLEWKDWNGKPLTDEYKAEMVQDAIRGAREGGMCAVSTGDTLIVASIDECGTVCVTDCLIRRRACIEDVNHTLTSPAGECWVALTASGDVTGAYGTAADAASGVRALDTTWPDDAPHRAVRMVPAEDADKEAVWLKSELRHAKEQLAAPLSPREHTHTSSLGGG
jgi:hypothetical protein